MSVIDYSDDYTYWDQTEAVTVTLRTSSSSASRSIATAKRTNANRRETTFQSVTLYGDEVFFLIPNALLEDDDKILEGDTITDATSVVYTVTAAQQVQKGASKTHFRCLVSERK